MKMLTPHQSYAYHWFQYSTGKKWAYRKAALCTMTISPRYPHWWFLPYGDPYLNALRWTMRRMYWQGKVTATGRLARGWKAEGPNFSLTFTPHGGAWKAWMRYSVGRATGG